MGMAEGERDSEWERWSEPEAPRTTVNTQAHHASSAPRERVPHSIGGALGRAMRVAASQHSDTLPEGLVHSLQHRFESMHAPAHDAHETGDRTHASADGAASVSSRLQSHAPKAPSPSASSSTAATKKRPQQQDGLHSSANGNSTRSRPHTTQSSTSHAHAHSASTPAHSITPTTAAAPESTTASNATVPFNADGTAVEQRGALQEASALEYTPPREPRLALRELSAQREQAHAAKCEHERRRNNLKALRQRLPASSCKANVRPRSSPKPRRTLLRPQLGRQPGDVHEEYNPQPGKKPPLSDNLPVLGGSPEAFHENVQEQAKELLRQVRESKKLQSKRKRQAAEAASRQAKLDKERARRMRKLREKREPTEPAHTDTAAHAEPWTLPPARQDVMHEQDSDSTGQKNEEPHRHVSNWKKYYKEEEIKNQKKKNFEKWKQKRFENDRLAYASQRRALDTARKVAVKEKLAAQEYKLEHPGEPSMPSAPWVGVFAESDGETIPATTVPVTPEQAKASVSESAALRVRAVSAEQRNSKRQQPSRVEAAKQTVELASQSDFQRRADTHNQGEQRPQRKQRLSHEQTERCSEDTASTLQSIPPTSRVHNRSFAPRTSKSSSSRGQQGDRVNQMPASNSNRVNVHYERRAQQKKKRSTSKGFNDGSMRNHENKKRRKKKKAEGKRADVPSSDKSARSRKRDTNFLARWQAKCNRKHPQPTGKKTLEGSGRQQLLLANHPNSQVSALIETLSDELIQQLQKRIRSKEEGGGTRKVASGEEMLTLPALEANLDTRAPALEGTFHDYNETGNVNSVPTLKDGPEHKENVTDLNMYTGEEKRQNEDFADGSHSSKFLPYGDDMSVVNLYLKRRKLKAGNQLRYQQNKSETDASAQTSPEHHEFIQPEFATDRTTKEKAYESDSASALLEQVRNATDSALKQAANRLTGDNMDTHEDAQHNDEDDTEHHLPSSEPRVFVASDDYQAEVRDFTKPRLSPSQLQTKLEQEVALLEEAEQIQRELEGLENKRQAAGALQSDNRRLEELHEKHAEQVQAVASRLESLLNQQSHQESTQMQSAAVQVRNGDDPVVAENEQQNAVATDVAQRFIQEVDEHVKREERILQQRRQTTESALNRELQHFSSLGRDQEHERERSNQRICTLQAQLEDERAEGERELAASRALAARQRLLGQMLGRVTKSVRSDSDTDDRRQEQQDYGIIEEDADVEGSKDETSGIEDMVPGEFYQKVDTSDATQDGEVNDHSDEDGTVVDEVSPQRQEPMPKRGSKEEPFETCCTEAPSSLSGRSKEEEQRLQTQEMLLESHLGHKQREKRHLDLHKRRQRVRRLQAQIQSLEKELESLRGEEHQEAEREDDLEDNQAYREDFEEATSEVVDEIEDLAQSEEAYIGEGVHAWESDSDDIGSDELRNQVERLKDLDREVRTKKRALFEIRERREKEKCEALGQLTKEIESEHQHPIEEIKQTRAQTYVKEEVNYKEETDVDDAVLDDVDINADNERVVEPIHGRDELHEKIEGKHSTGEPLTPTRAIEKEEDVDFDYQHDDFEATPEKDERIDPVADPPVVSEANDNQIGDSRGVVEDIQTSDEVEDAAVDEAECKIAVNEEECMSVHQEYAADEDEGEEDDSVSDEGSVVEHDVSDENDQLQFLHRGEEVVAPTDAGDKHCIHEDQREHTPFKSNVVYAGGNASAVSQKRKRALMEPDVRSISRSVREHGLKDALPKIVREQNLDEEQTLLYAEAAAEAIELVGTNASDDAIARRLQGWEASASLRARARADALARDHERAWRSIEDDRAEIVHSLADSILQSLLDDAAESCLPLISTA